MTVCSYEGCSREIFAAASSTHCIMHHPGKDKDALFFEQAVEQVIAQARADLAVTSIDLRGVVFPVPVKWEERFLPRHLDIRDARFLQAADFSGASFGGEARFSGATFSKEADFSWASFSRATFSKEADFSGARFGGTANFSNARFQQAVRFRNTSFPKNPHYLDFGEVVLEKPEEVFFEHVNLSRASFLRTDMTRVRLVGVEWREPAPEGKPSVTDPWWRRAYVSGKALMKEILKMPRQRLLLYDHHVLLSRRWALPQYYHLVELLYRQLRINLEDSKQYVEAGEFYVGEMETKRLNPDGTDWGPQWLLRLYGWAAVYGESYGRPFLLYLLLGLPFAFLYLWLGFHTLGADIAYDFSALTAPIFGLS